MLPLLTEGITILYDKGGESIKSFCMFEEVAMRKVQFSCIFLDARDRHSIHHPGTGRRGISSPKI